MDDLARYCARMLGDAAAGRAAVQTARGEAGGDRSAMLRAAVAAVRQGSEPAAEPAPNAPAATDDGPAHPDERPTDPTALRDAIARELATAAGALPLAAREALALRELLGLGYDELAAATGVAVDEVPLLLARARLDLRTQLRGAGAPQPECDERERALRTIARRQDGEDVASADDDWLIEHLGHCRGCRQAHAAMLEASACYRAWAAPEMPPDPVASAAGS
jgi:hypothetical protein